MQGILNLTCFSVPDIQQITPIRNSAFRKIHQPASNTRRLCM